MVLSLSSSRSIWSRSERRDLDRLWAARRRLLGLAAAADRDPVEKLLGLVGDLEDLLGDLVVEVRVVRVFAAHSRGDVDRREVALREHRAEHPQLPGLGDLVRLVDREVDAADAFEILQALGHVLVGERPEGDPFRGLLPEVGGEAAQAGRVGVHVDRRDLVVPDHYVAGEGRVAALPDLNWLRAFARPVLTRPAARPVEGVQEKLRRLAAVALGH